MTMKSISLERRMRKSIISLHRVVLPIPALLLFLLVSSARAGENPKPAEARHIGYDLEIVDGILVQDGKKENATLANVVDVLRARYPEANIALAPGLGKLEISD